MMRFPPFTTSSSRRLALIALAASAAPSFAQTTQTTPPANGQLPQTIPGLDNFTIAPRSPVPMPGSTPTPTPTPTPAQVVPVRPLPSPTPTPQRQAPRATPTAPPRATPTSAPRTPPAPMPNSTPTPAAIVTPAAAPPIATAPTPQATASPATAPSPAPRHSLLWIALFIALLLLPALGVVLWFLRRNATGARAGETAWDEDDDWVASDQREPGTVPALAPVPVKPPRHPPGTSARPQLEITFVPRRAGANITSAAVEYDLEVRNTGAVAAEDVRVRVDLVTAGNDHDALLKAPFDQPVDTPMTAPFTLPAADKIGLRAMVMLPKSAISVVTVKGRPMFVPIVAVDVRYRWAGGEGQTAESFVIGIAPKDGERMRPFWLDVTPRMYDTATARPHAVGARR